MSNEFGWKPRKKITLTCPESGQKVIVRRPGPELTLRLGRVSRTFSDAKQKAEERQEGESETDYQRRVINEMSDEELARTVLIGKELVLAMLVSPTLVLNPDPEKGEIGPEDIGNDFWFLVDYAQKNFYDIKVPVGDTEVEVKDLESFRPIDGISGDGVDSAHIGPTSQHAA